VGSQRTERKPAPSDAFAPIAKGTGVAAQIMPIGKSKGRRLDSLDELTLIGALKWMQENGATKYTTSITAIEGELESRRRLAEENAAVTARIGGDPHELDAMVPRR
jgi:hypothetical protein